MKWVLSQRFPNAQYYWIFLIAGTITESRKIFSLRLEYIAEELSAVILVELFQNQIGWDNLFVFQKTGARIKIYSSCCPDSTDRVVQLTGAGNTAIECLKEILELIKTVGFLNL